MQAICWCWHQPHRPHVSLGALVKHIDHRETTASLPTSVAHDACNARVWPATRNEQPARRKHRSNDAAANHAATGKRQAFAGQAPADDTVGRRIRKASKTISMLPPKEHLLMVDLAEAEESGRTGDRRQFKKSGSSAQRRIIPTEETAAASLAKLIGKALVRDAVTMTEREPVTTFPDEAADSCHPGHDTPAGSDKNISRRDRKGQRLVIT